MPTSEQAMQKLRDRRNANQETQIDQEFGVAKKE